MSAPFLTSHLESTHLKQDFCCGKPLLDNYLHKQAKQDIKRKLTACFVLLKEETNIIIGYYTLSNNGIMQHKIPEEYKKQLPKSYSILPTTLLGRLAIDQKFIGKGHGKLLLMDAIKRSFEVSKSVASFAVIVDPIDIEAEKFYANFGFIKLPNSGKMFLPMKTISKLFA